MGPCIDIEQNDENHARYGGPMPWPPLPCEDWGYPEMNFDKEKLIEMRIQGLMMFHMEKIIVVRQLWALENWEKWTKECEEKGIEPEDHLKIYDTLSKLKVAIQRSVDPYVKRNNVRDNVIMLHEEKQHSLRDKYVRSELPWQQNVSRLSVQYQIEQ